MTLMASSVVGTTICTARMARISVESHLDRLLDVVRQYMCKMFSCFDKSLVLLLVIAAEYRH